MKTRLEEIDEMLAEIHSTMSTAECIRAEMLIKLELERRELVNYSLKNNS